MLKNFILFLTVFIFFSACGDDKEDEKPTPEKPETIVTDEITNLQTNEDESSGGELLSDASEVSQNADKNTDGDNSSVEKQSTAQRQQPSAQKDSSEPELNLGDNLIYGCTPDGFDCKLAKIQFAGLADEETFYDVEYTFVCSGHSFEVQIGFATLDGREDYRNISYNIGRNKVLRIQSKGNLRVLASNDKRFQSAVKVNCEFIIHQVSQIAVREFMQQNP